jgi:hypothetical protein
LMMIIMLILMARNKIMMKSWKRSMQPDCRLP